MTLLDGYNTVFIYSSALCYLQIIFALLTLQCTAARSYGQPSPKRELDQARIPREKFYLFSHDFLRVHWDIAIRFIIVRIHNLLWILTFLNSGTALHLFIQAAIDIILIRYLFSYPILRI